MKRLIPPVLATICLALMVSLRWAWPIATLLRPPLIWLGMIPVVGGLAADLAALYHLKKLHTTTRPFREARHLATGGVYRYTRNPMYLGIVLILLGVWILLGAVSPVGPVVVFAVIIDRWHIRGEEKMLDRKFGQEYEEYRRRTHRWI